jgi:hypothetical protein
LKTSNAAVAIGRGHCHSHITKKPGITTEHPEVPGEATWVEGREGMKNRVGNEKYSNIN